SNTVWPSSKPAETAIASSFSSSQSSSAAQAATVRTPQWAHSPPRGTSRKAVGRSPGNCTLASPPLFRRVGTERHGAHQVALDLKLAGHERLLALQLAAAQPAEIVQRDHQGRVRLAVLV